jgi:hypothetical protein
MVRYEIYPQRRRHRKRLTRTHQNREDDIRTRQPPIPRQSRLRFLNAHQLIFHHAIHE